MQTPQPGLLVHFARLANNPTGAQTSKEQLIEVLIGAALLIDAAAQSLGVARARFSLVADLLANGDLICPLPLATPTAYAYYLVARRGPPGNRAFPPLAARPGKRDRVGSTADRDWGARAIVIDRGVWLIVSPAACHLLQTCRSDMHAPFVFASRPSGHAADDELPGPQDIVCGVGFAVGRIEACNARPVSHQ
jgi:hypothetical protein